ncbi:MAG: PAS domain S-box protein [Candidatus Hydrogenedentes bacterium]|nr:PAS domain S-box protein [Candidatus Hydrogenedentota bacterium]
MLDFLWNVFETSDFPARWTCGTWTSGHGWLHIGSDIAIWGAYMAIPATLAYFILRRKDVPFLPIFWLFAAFIFSCGATHLLDAVIFWWPAYRLSGTVKFITATVSWATVFALLPVLPRALALPGLSTVNAELNRALNAKSRSEARFRQVIEAAPNGIVMVDTGGKILLANTACATIFGYRLDELIGQYIDALAPERLRDAHSGFRELFQRDPETRPMGQGRDLHGLRKDGTEIPIEIGLSPIETDDGLLVLASIMDITERKRAEETLVRYSADLERSNRELDEFAYVASHDLRSPLEGIEQLAAWVVEDAAPYLPEDSLRHLTQIQQRAARLRTLLDDLLQYSRAGRKLEDAEQVSTSQLIAEIVTDLNAPPGFRVEYDPDLPVFYTLKTPLRHILQNLIGNAIKHHNRAGGLIRVLCVEEENCYRFTVADDGPGIDPAFHDRVFMMFETLRSRDQVEGSGMGLAIVKKILDTFGGSIHLESVPGAGAAFEVEWPRTGGV